MSGCSDTDVIPVSFRCRACDEQSWQLVLDLGATPLANALLDAEDLLKPEARYPLVVVRCRTCSLVQITETVPPEDLFSEYVYFSSFSDAAVASASSIAERLVAALGLNTASLVAEVGSNDGYLLKHYSARGIPVLGVEPAGNVAAAAQAAGIRTEVAFFGDSEAKRLVESHGRADVIHANNVLAHVADLRGVVRGLSTLLADSGVASIEVPYLRDLLANVEFDTIYHEHLCYFSLTTLVRLFEREGLRIVGVEPLRIHGGSLRLFAARAEASVGERYPYDADAVARLEAEEQAWGVDGDEAYSGFAQRIETLRDELVGLLSERKARGRRIAAYGASAKGSTLLNAFGIGGNILDYVVDRSSVKQGRFTPGTRLAIHPPDWLLDDAPDDVLLLTWNFADEILAQQAEYQRRGGRFIVPLPQPRVIEPGERGLGEA